MACNSRRLVQDDCAALPFDVALRAINSLRIRSVFILSISMRFATRFQHDVMIESQSCLVKHWLRLKHTTSWLQWSSLLMYGLRADIPTYSCRALC